MLLLLSLYKKKIYLIFPSVKKCDSAVVDQLVNGESLTSKTSFFDGDQLEYICNVGFKVANGMGSSQTILCQQDGTWNIIPSCTRKFCKVAACCLRGT